MRKHFGATRWRRTPAPGWPTTTSATSCWIAANWSAESRFREAIRLKPDHVEARVSLGMVAEKRGQLEVAEQWYRQAQAIEPQNALSAYNLQRLARIYNNIGAR